MACVYWFRKALRLHDSPSLLAALSSGTSFCPLFLIDPFFRVSGRVGALRYNHLIETLVCLDKGLKERGSSLVVIEGWPQDVFAKILQLSVTLLAFESDTEPYAVTRDAEVRAIAEKLNVEVITASGHTLFDLEEMKKRAKGKVPSTYGQFCKLISDYNPAKPVPAPERLPSLPRNDWVQEALKTCPSGEWMRRFSLPLGPGQSMLIRGGEDVALLKMEMYLSDSKRVASFEKPKTDPTKSWLGTSDDIPSGATTVLSPYLHFGSLSPRLFYWKLIEAEKKHKNASKPPVSLVGQLLWREFFHFVGAFTENFDRIQGNPICRQIAWRTDREELFEAWRMATTGYPWIDAIMTQLRTEGWIHHLARHCVACFLTRGDLYVSWEKGVRVFEELLVDADWSLNNANWMWLSCSAFFSQYWKVYSPIAFGKKYDPEGVYIKKYLPFLKNYPAKFIYEPWTAPIADQKKWGCRIGQDYPRPITKHEEASKECISSLKKFFADSKAEPDNE